MCCHSERRWYIGLAEVIPFEKQRFPGNLRQSIGETVSKIEPGGMTALAVIGVRLLRRESLIMGYTFDGNSSGLQKSI